jgi:hypothetical protein
MTTNLDNLDQLKRLRSSFDRLAGPPGLFHVTRVRFAAKACKVVQERQGWKEFLGQKIPFEFHTSETRAGRHFQQGCYFGAKSKLDHYTSLAATAIAHFPVDSDPVPISYHHRDACVDRDQWTIAMYCAAAGLDWKIAVDSQGSEDYAKFQIDVKDALTVTSGFIEQDRMARYFEGIKAAIERIGHQPPQYLYAAITTDLFAISSYVVEKLIHDIEAGIYAPDSNAFPLDKLLGIPPVDLDPQRSGKIFIAKDDNYKIGDKNEHKGDARDDFSPWPPDTGWHFHSGEYAIMGRVHKLAGTAWEFLNVFVSAEEPLTRRKLEELVWGGAIKSISTIRSTLSKLRTHLRTEFGLSKQVDPIPCVARGKRVAWILEEDVLLASCKENKRGISAKVKSRRGKDL